MSYSIVEYGAKLEWLTGRYECRKEGAVQSAEWGMKNKSPLFEQKRAKQKQKKDRRCKVQSTLFQVGNRLFNFVGC
ncbi:MAG: hypothetical protein OHK0053_32940 [Microscillaceae bacterium]